MEGTSPNDSPPEGQSRQDPSPLPIRASPGGIALDYSSEYNSKPAQWVCLAESLTSQQYTALQESLNAHNIPVRQGRVDMNSSGDGSPTTGLLVPGEFFQLALDVHTETGSPGIVPSGPIIPLDYQNAPIGNDYRWTRVARCTTVAEWQNLKVALGKANIMALMDTSVSPQPLADDAPFELQVLSENAGLARRIVEARLRNRDWCPHCGSAFVRDLPLAWYWYVLAVVFIMMPPFWPPSKECGSCRRTWS